MVEIVLFLVMEIGLEEKRLKRNKEAVINSRPPSSSNGEKVGSCSFSFAFSR